MDARFSLRFESGDRAGEVVPIQGQGFTIGRRPGHSLQILDNSVSGKHAEIAVDDRGAVLRDLGSTNGTRVAGERVIETRLVNGARVQIGNVELVFLDSAAAGFQASPAPATSPVPAASASATDTLLRLSPEILARAKKPSVAGIGAVLLLLGGAAGAWLWFHRTSDDGGARPGPAVPSSDNLLGEDYSFESETDGWTAAEGAPAAFLRGASGRVSGGLGLVADLAGGDYALHRSREVRAAPGKVLAARAQVRVDGGASAQIGIELLPAGSLEAEGAASRASVVAWSAPLAGGSGFSAVEVATTVPPGRDTARLVLLARASGAGTAAVDDVELVAREPSGGAPMTVKDNELTLLGDPARAAVLTRFGAAQLSLVAFAPGGSIEETASAGPISARPDGAKIAIGSPGAQTLCLRAEPPLVRAGLATLGADGYSTHGLDFERAGVTSLLLGKGAELLRLAFAEPVTLQGVAEGSATRIVARGNLADVALQLDFTDERKQAGDLAYAARNAEKKGDLGDCLARWAELLNAFPFDAELVQEAEAKRAALVQQGLGELQEVRAGLERARFFKLVDLFRRWRKKAVDVGARFHGSEVETEAQKVAAEIDGDLAGFEKELGRAERARLRSILAGLEARKAEGLAGLVRDHLQSLGAED